MLPVAIEGTESAPGEEGTTELFGLEASIVLRTDKVLDAAGNVIETRLTLDFQGTARVVYLGNIASVAGRFVLVTPASGNPQFWGVIKLDTNFEMLLPLGIDADLFAMLQINTTDQEHVETITLEGQAAGGGDLTETYVLSANSFRIEAAGRLVMGIANGAGTAVETTLIEMRGAFTFIVNAEGMTVFAAAQVVIGPASFKLAEMEALGLMIINDEGFALRLEISSAINIPLLDFNASFALLINTTSKDQEFEVPEKFFEYLSADFIYELQQGKGSKLFAGTLNEAEKASLDSGVLPSAMTTSFSNAGLALSGAVEVRRIYADSRWEMVDATGKAYVLEKSDQNPNTIDVYESRGKKFVVIPRGPPQLDGTLGTTGAYVVMQAAGSLDVAGLLVVEGSFRFEISANKFEFFVSATASLGVLGSFGVVGQLTVVQEGVYGTFVLARQGSMPGAFSLTGSFLVELNTTGNAQTIKTLDINTSTGAVANELVDKILQGTDILRIVVGANLTIANVFVIQGRIDMLISVDGFELTINGKLDLGYFGKIEIVGGAIIRADVLAIHLTVNATLGFGPFSLSGAFTLNINTGSKAIVVGGATVAGNTYLVNVAAKLQVWVLEANGSVTIGISSGNLLMSLDYLTINFFNFVTLNASGYVNSNGSFQLNASVTMSIPLGPFKLSGGLEIKISNGGAEGFTLWGHAWGSISIKINLPWPLPDIKFNLARIDGYFEYRAASDRLGLSIKVGPFRMNGEIVWSFATPKLARM